MGKGAPRHALCDGGRVERGFSQADFPLVSTPIPRVSASLGLGQSLSPLPDALPSMFSQFACLCFIGWTLWGIKKERGTQAANPR